MNDLAARGVLDPLNSDPELQVDPISDHGLLDDPCRIGVFPDQHMGCHIEQGDLATESSESLGQLTPDRPAADDTEAARQLGQREDRFVGQKAAFLAPGNGGDEGSSSGRDDGSAKTQATSPNLDGVPGDEASLTDEHVDAQIAKATGAVMAADSSAQPPHSLHDGCEVSVANCLWPAESVGRGSSLVPCTRGTDHRLGGYTAIVEAITAQQSAFDQGHSRSEAGSTRRRDESSSTGAQYDQVIAIAGLRIDPLRRVDILEESLIVGVEGLHQSEQLGIHATVGLRVIHSSPPGPGIDSRCGSQEWSRRA